MELWGGAEKSIIHKDMHIYILIKVVVVVVVTVTLGYRYTETNQLFLTPVLIGVKMVHASQGNVCDMVRSFDKSNA